MAVLVITPPEQIVSLAMARLHLRVSDDYGDEDSLIDSFCKAAQASFDGPMGWLGRCIGRQTLEIRTNTFSGAEALPYGPVLGVTSVKYVDPTGAEQTLAEDAYQLDNGCLIPAPSAYWPQVRGDAEGVRVRYEAGFDPAPPAAHQAILLMVSAWFNLGRDGISPDQLREIPYGAEALLSPYRKY